MHSSSCAVPSCKPPACVHEPQQRTVGITIFMRKQTQQPARAAPTQYCCVQVLLSNPPNLHAPDFIFGEDPSFQPLCGSLPSAQLSSLQQALLAWPQLPAMATNPAAATTGSMQQLLLPEETAGSSAVSGSSSGSSSSAQSAPSVPSAPVMAKALAALLRSLLSHFRDHHLGRLALAAAADERLAFELSMLPTTAPPAAVSTSPNEPDLKLAGTNDQYPKPGGASVEITSGGEGAASGMAAPVSGAAGPAEAGSGGQPAVHSALEVMYVEARDGEPPKVRAQFRLYSDSWESISNSPSIAVSVLVTVAWPCHLNQDAAVLG